ncbi:hypothetical protein SALB1_2970 [Salinisphaera sp. LB1]|nr:hypothetical protein SALB1_2970 [Salinisphaera sp. LB1]
MLSPTHDEPLVFDPDRAPYSGRLRVGHPPCGSIGFASIRDGQPAPQAACPDPGQPACAQTIGCTGRLAYPKPFRICRPYPRCCRPW